MKQEILIQVENLSKKFCKDLKTSLWYGVKDLFSNIIGSESDNKLRSKEFWAINNISFKLRRGECLGLIGHNGAGKSTLLKILNGLINPDIGKITMKGRVGALIELGAGFNPILSGRENVYNNGAILGFSRQEIDSKMDTIIEFAEISEFIDMPVQHYSSGMKVRLGFAIAAQMKPDVLIIDEVLAVGDLGFVLKCFKTIDRLLPNTAVIFVSHNMPLVSRICNKIILLENGTSLFHGSDISAAIDIYYTRFTNNETNIVFSDGSIEFQEVKLLSATYSEGFNNQINRGDDFKVYFRFTLSKQIEMPIFTIHLFDKEQRSVAMLERNDINSSISFKGNYLDFVVTTKNIQLSKGVYSISLAVGKMNNREPILRINNILSFQVVHEDQVWSPFLLTSTFSNFEYNQVNEE